MITPLETNEMAQAKVKEIEIDVDLETRMSDLLLQIKGYS